jgi:integrase
VLPKIGSLKVDRTTTRRLEELFEAMVETTPRARSTGTGTTSTRRSSTACRNRTIKTNSAADVLLPAKRPSKERKSFTVDQAHALLTEAIPADTRPAMWLTGLMCGLRPGELAGLRWPYVDIDSDQPVVEVFEPTRWTTSTSGR